MTWGPFSRISPSTPGAAREPSSATTTRSTPGVGRPSVAASFSSGSPVVAITTMGASVSPYPETMPTPPISAFTSWWSWGGLGAPPPGHERTRGKSRPVPAARWAAR